MGKLFVFGTAFLLLLSCNQNKNNNNTDGASGSDFNADELPQIFLVNAKAKKILGEWPEFNGLETSFEALYRAKNKEDLVFVIDDLIEKQKLLAASTYPEAFDIPQIKSRQRVFRTYILKVKASLEYRTETATPVLEMVQAYNAMRNQFNVVVNNTLDTQLILDE